MYSTGLLIPLVTLITIVMDVSCLSFGSEDLTLQSVADIFSPATPSLMAVVQQEEGQDRDRIRRAAASSGSGQPSATHFKKMMRLLQAGKLQDCAGRVVCDLSCDAARFGPNGKKVFAMMNKVQDSGVMDVEDMQLLGTAGASGRLYYWTTGCTRCKDVYPSCFTESADLIDVASIFDMDSF